LGTVALTEAEPPLSAYPPAQGETQPLPFSTADHTVEQEIRQQPPNPRASRQTQEAPRTGSPSRRPPLIVEGSAPWTPMEPTITDHYNTAPPHSSPGGQPSDQPRSQRLRAELLGGQFGEVAEGCEA
jgi:hypothetical protein